MLEFYKAIKEGDPKKRRVAMTLTDGAYLGEKALFFDKELVWCSKEDGFFSCGQPLVEEIKDSGIVVVNGSSVFCDVLSNDKRLVVCGGGHVSILVIRIGQLLGFEVWVLEDRPKFADDARRAGATQVICSSFEEGLDQIKGDKDTFFVIVTRGHRWDQTCLERIAIKEHGYIGMIGSRRRVSKVKEAMIEKGLPIQVINQIHAPIGLDIGARTPEEIGVAIMAQIIQVKNKIGSGGFPKEILEEMLAIADSGEERVLATIVTRKGSAPREIGAKMAVRPDGTSIGTIGGGCVEAGIVTEALSMLRTGEELVKLCHVDMTGEFAEEDAMVCGGAIDVLLEKVCGG